MRPERPCEATMTRQLDHFDAVRALQCGQYGASPGFQWRGYG